jgi:hypothetical protein
MPARRPVTPRPRDQLVDQSADSDQGKQRAIAETARVVSDVAQRLSRLDARPEVVGSRLSGEAFVSLLDALSNLGLITDKTTL